MFSLSLHYSLSFLLACLLLALPACSDKTTSTQEQTLSQLLGAFPAPPPLNIDTLETLTIENGHRYKIVYTVEEADTLFDRPTDRVKAYLFVPTHKKKQQIPAIVAIHQDGSRFDLGKLEPAGLGGSADQAYGLELFQRGYVVICPDRFGHAERRRLENANPHMPPMMQNLSLWMRWSGQLILQGRTYFGKEVYDLMRAVDVLSSLEFVDPQRIGAIGHSAAGNVLVYFMFMDKRIKAGVSSCGFFDLIDYYNDKEPGFANAIFAIPHLATSGRSEDYLAQLAPRPFLMTRGLWEHGKQSPMEKKLSRAHVARTKQLEKLARLSYKEIDANEKFQSLYFDGGHIFPAPVRKEAYNFLDRYLK